MSKRELLHDPPHHRDSSAPCWSCGAKWIREKGSASVMDHEPYCQFIADQDAELSELELKRW